MAVIQYGAIVTEIKGSLGGHTFKSQRGTKVIMNKSAGFSRAKQLSNRALSYAGFIFASWTQLPEDAREVWNNSAALMLFPDKYGNQVHISGRELFTKCNLNLGSGYFIERPGDGFNNSVAPFQISDGFIGVAPNTATIDMTRFFGGNVWYDVSAEVSVNKLNAPVFRTRELLKRFQEDDSATLDFTAEFFAKFPYVLGGYYVRVYVTPINNSGLKGVTQYFDSIVDLELPVYELLSAEIPNAGGDCYLYLDSLYNSGWFIFVWAQYATDDYPEEDFNTATPLGVYLPNEANRLNLSGILLVTFPDMEVGDYVRFYTKLYRDGTSFGFPQTTTARVEALAIEFTIGAIDISESGASGTLAFSSTGSSPLDFTVLATFSEFGVASTDIETATEVTTWPIENGSPINLDGLLPALFPAIGAGTSVRLFMYVSEIGEQLSPAQSGLTTVIGADIAYTITDINCEALGESTEILFNVEFPANYTMDVYALWLGGAVPPNTFGSAELIGEYPVEESGRVDVGSEVFSVYSEMEAGDNIRFWTILKSEGVELGTVATATTVVTA